MSSILISHRNKSHDNDWAVRIHAWIKDQKDIDGFLDFNIQHGLQAGGNWENDIYAAMNRAQVVIALLSPDWLESDWCMSEARMAKLRGLQLIPAMIADCKNPFPEIQYIDFTTDHDGAFERLRSALKTTHPLPKQPYPGLCAFQEKDAAVFFGREDETRDLINRVASLFQGRPETPRLLLVLGASGSGKSSLARAGLIPVFSSDPQQICVEPIIPRGAPLKEIARKLDITFDGLDPAASADRILAALKQKHPSFKRALITIDQAEELLRGDNKLFVNVMRLLLDKGDGQIVVLATMRSDFLNEFQQSGLIGAGSDLDYETFTIDPMPEDRLSDIIRKPAKLYGVEYQDALIDQIKSDHGGPDALPLLAFFLGEFWRPDYFKDGELQLSEYEAFGGLSKALEKAVDRALGDCRKLDKAYAAGQTLLNDLKEVFLGSLVSISSINGEPIRNRVPASALSDNQRSLLVPFEKQRLLISKNDEWEVVHEALFRQWADFKKWIAEAREDLVTMDRIKTASKQWHDEGREDHDLVHSGNRLSEAIRLSLSARYATRFLPVDKDYLEECDRRYRDQLELEKSLREKAENESDRAQIGENKAKRYTKIVAAVAAIAVLIGGLAGWQWKQAERRAAENNAAIIWSRLDFEGSNELRSEPAANALSDLATSDADVRDAFLKQLSEQNHLVTLVSQGPALISRAFGLVHDSSDSIRLLTPVIEAMGQTTDEDQLKSLSSAVAILAPKLDTAHAAAPLTTVLEAMGQTTDYKQLDALSSAVATLGPTPAHAAAALTPVLEAMGQTTDFYQLKSLSSAVAILAPKLDTAHAAAALTPVLEAMGQTTYYRTLNSLSSAVAILEPTPAHAAAALTPVLEAMGQTTDSYQLESLSSAVAILAPTPAHAAAALTSVLEAMGQTTDYKQLDALSSAVATLAPKLDTAHAAAALTPVIEAMGETTDYKQLDAFLSAVAILAPTPAHAAAALTTVLEAMGQTTDYKQLDALSSAVATLAPKLDTAHAAAALTTVLEAMGQTTDEDQLDTFLSAVAILEPTPVHAAAALTPVLEAMGQTTDEDQLESLSSAVAILAPKLDTAHAAAALTTVLEAMGQTTDSYQLNSLSSAVATLAPKLDTAHAAAALTTVLEAMGQTTDSYQLNSLSSAVATLAPKLDTAHAAAALTTVLEAMGQTTDYKQLDAFLSAVAILAPTPAHAVALMSVFEAMGETTDEDQLESLSSAVAILEPTPAHAAAALTTVLEAMGQTTDEDLLDTFLSAVAILAPKLDTAHAAAALTTVLEAMGQTTDYSALNSLSSAVATLAPKLDTAHAAAALTTVLEAMGQTTDSYQLKSLSSAVATLAPKLDTAHAAAALTTVLEAMDQTTDSYQLKSLSSAVAILTPTPAHAAAALTTVFEAMDQTTDYRQLDALSSAVAILGPTPAQAAAALTPVLEAMGQTTDSYQLYALSSAVATLAPKLDSVDIERSVDVMRWRLSTSHNQWVSAVLGGTIARLLPAIEPKVYVTEVVELLKWPTTAGSPTNDVLDVMAERIPSAPGSEAGLQANLDWVKETYPGIDLKGQPVRPSFNGTSGGI